MGELEALVALGRRMETCPELVMQVAAEWLQVRDRTGRFRPLVANSAQRAFEARRGRQNIVLKARQMGLTTWVAARFFLHTITHPGTLTLLVAHTQAAAEGVFSSVERMWQGLPDDLRRGVLRRSRANAGQMVLAELGSEFRVGSAADANAGRGLSVQNLHCSEVSRWPRDAAATLSGLRAALDPGGELVLESTPNGAYGCFYEEWSSAVEPAVESMVEPAAESAVEFTAESGLDCGDKWREAAEPRSSPSGLVRHFLPWWMEAAYVGPPVGREAMTEGERALVDRHGLTREQIGFRRGLERSYGALRSQEFAEDAESCFRATGDCCFDVDRIERRASDLEAPRERRRGGALLLWLPPAPGRSYVLGVDTAGGGEGGDFAAVQVVELATGLQCAELQERISPAELAGVVAELGREYGGVNGEALLAVERNNHGSAVLAYLETAERYGRVYRQSGLAGWLTTASSKPEMVAGLGVLLRESPGRFMSRRLLRECRTFVRGERGTTDAAPGAHDDLVMAMAVAQAVRSEMLAAGGARR